MFFYNSPSKRLYKKVSLLSVFFFIVVLSTGCTSMLQKWALKQGYKDKAQVDKELTQLGIKFEKDKSELADKIEKQYNGVIFAQKTQLQLCADSFFAADKTYQIISKPVRTDIIINNYVKEGWQVTGNLLPSVEKMAQINDRLKKELDEKVTSIEELEAVHKVILNENKTLSDDSKKKEGDLKVLQDKMTQLKSDFRDEKTRLLEEDRIKSDKIILLEKQRSDDKALQDEKKWKMMSVTGALALLCIAGSIWSPVWKTKFMIGAGVFGTITLGINYLEPWMIGVFVTIVILGIVGHSIYEHYIESNTSTGVYRAVQELKTTNKEVYEAHLKPLLETWLTKYDKNNQSVPDTSAQNHIDEKLKKAGDL